MQYILSEQKDFLAYSLTLVFMNIFFGTKFVHFVGVNRLLSVIVRDVLVAFDYGRQ